MSVIFEALQKVRQSEATDLDAPTGEAPPANVYTIRGLLLSPQGILGIALFIVLVGVVAYYGAAYLESAVKPRGLSVASTGKSTSRDKTGSSQEIPTAEPAGVENTVPPPPQEITYQRPEPGKLYLPATKAGKRPPAHEMATDAVYLPAGQIAGKEVRRSLSVKGLTPLGQERHKRAESDNLPVSVSLHKIQSGFSVQAKSEPTPVMGQGSSGAAPAKAMTVAVSDKRAKLSEPAHRVEENMAKEAVGIHKGQEKQIKESGEKTALITHLVIRLQAAMIRDDTKRVQDLLGRLKGLKGQNDPFLLKAQAYWEMKRGNYEKARRLLDTVLAQRPNDCEAGFNMAVIEVNEGLIERAKERLKSLREMYPANVKISDLLREING